MRPLSRSLPVLLCCAAMAACTEPKPRVTVASIVPSAGPTTGGTVVTITGTRFPTSVDSVLLGTTARLLNLVRVSETQLTGVTSACVSAGPVDVVVHAGTAGSATCPACFSYNAPLTVIGVAPSGGPLAGGTVISISGTGFPATIDSVLFGTRPLTNVVRVSATVVTGTTPEGSVAGKADVTVYSGPAGSGNCTACFTYYPLVTVGAVIPSYAPLEGGVGVMITGTFVGPIDSVRIGAGRLLSPYVDVGMLIEWTVPPSSVSGPVDVTVFSSAAGNSTCAGCFTYSARDQFARYSVTFLGTGFDSSWAADMNDSGAVVGEVWTSATGWRTRLWPSAGAPADLDSLHPTAINNALSVLGRLGGAWNAPLGLWENGATRLLGGLDSLGSALYASDLNNRRQVAILEGSGRAYLWQNDSLTELQRGMNWLSALGRMNDSSAVAATSHFGYDYAEIITTASTVVLQGGGRWSRAYAVNNAGVAVGSAEWVMGHQGGGWLFGTGALPFGPAAINDSGQIVGEGMIGRNGAAATLSALVTDSSWKISGAVAINNRGQIAAYGVNTATGQRGAVRLDPIAGTSGSPPGRRR